MIVKMFKPRFAEPVRTVRKLQTIRPTPKRMPRVGDKISLRMWADKPYRSRQLILKTGTITAVHPVTISLDSFSTPDGTIRLKYALNTLARKDGFSGWGQLVAWFILEHGLPFTGILIRWSLD